MNCFVPKVAAMKVIEGGAQWFTDVMKAREAYFRPYDNQMVMEMYAVRAKEPAKMKDQWDIYDPLGTVPGPSEDMEVIAPPKDGTCKIG